MNATKFKAGGALNNEHVAVYIERQTEQDARSCLLAMDYMLIVEPRQQGKTSLINALMRHPALRETYFVYIDITTLNQRNEISWYKTITKRIADQLKQRFEIDHLTLAGDHTSWRSFLIGVAEVAIKTNLKIVIALDEIGAVKFSGENEFFSVLREIYNSREVESYFKSITFLLLGTFHPRDLISDDRISPFNIAQRVRLYDFTLEEVRQLVTRGGWPKEQTDALAQRIHYWTDGQPYLTQLICSYISINATVSDVDSSVQRLLSEDENHLPPLLKRLKTDKKLHEYVGRIQAGEKIKFSPLENQRQSQLELLGVIKKDIEGFCKIRNSIYKLALDQNNDYEASNAKGANMSTIDSTVSQELVEQFKKGNVALFIGAGLSIGAGLPGWADLISPLAKRIKYKGKNWLEAAQFYENRKSRNELIAYLRDRLDTTLIIPTENHRLLTKLPTNIVLTTNLTMLS